MIMTREQIEQLACNMSKQEMNDYYELLRQAIRNAFNRVLCGQKEHTIKCQIPAYGSVGLSDSMTEFITSINMDAKEGIIWVQTDCMPMIDIDDMSIDEQLYILEML